MEGKPNIELGEIIQRKMKPRIHYRIVSMHSTAGHYWDIVCLRATYDKRKHCWVSWGNTHHLPTQEGNKAPIGYTNLGFALSGYDYYRNRQ